MYFSAGNPLLIGSLVIFLSILICSKVNSKFGVPMLLLFLFAGMFFGSDGVGIQFNNPKLAQTIGMFSLSIILFTGGLDTQYHEIKPVLKQGIALSTLGVLLTTLFTGTFIFLITKNLNVAIAGSFPLSLLLAATMSSTDSASVFNILRAQNIGLRKHLRPMLELESGSNDPMAYMLTIALIQICLSASTDISVIKIVMNFILQFVIGGGLGLLFGYLTVKIVNRIRLNNTSLYPIVILSLIFFIFSATELARGNGYLAVYVAGIIVGNKPLVRKRECANFLDGLTWFCQVIMFITLGLLVNPHELIDVAIIGVIIALFMIFIGRPLAVFISLAPFKKPSDIGAKIFASWVGLRGAAPILFATYPLVSNVHGGEMIFDIVFVVTIVSLLLQGMTIPYMAKKCVMTRDLPKEGNDFGIDLPEELNSKLWEMDVDESLLVNGPLVKNLKLPAGVLIMIIKRNEDYIIPNGMLELKIGDKMLMISQSTFDQEMVLQN